MKHVGKNDSGHGGRGLVLEDYASSRSDKDADDSQDLAPEGEPPVGITEQSVSRQIVVHVRVEPEIKWFTILLSL